MIHRAELGIKGESIAERFLKKNGYEIIAKNFRTRYGEIDIIARDCNTVVFIEVKTRTGSDEYGSPELAVNIYKQKHLVKAAIAYIKKKSLNTDYRFDVIAISGDKINHIKNAFLPEKYTI